MTLFIVFFFDCYGDTRDLHSFPTRRSSDLVLQVGRATSGGFFRWRAGNSGRDTKAECHYRAFCRSEEHTSELQSHVNLVCRLLLEKKKNNTHDQTTS